MNDVDVDIDGDKIVDEIMAKMGQQFRTFAEILKDKPLQFAAGVDVRDVVTFVARETCMIVMDRLQKAMESHGFEAELTVMEEGKH